MKYLIQFLKGKKKILFLIFLTALLQAFGTLIVPYFVAEIINVGIEQKTYQLLYPSACKC